MELLLNELRLVAKRSNGWELCICDGRLRYGDVRSKVRMIGTIVR